MPTLGLPEGVGNGELYLWISEAVCGLLVLERFFNVLGNQLAAVRLLSGILISHRQWRLICC